MYHFIGIKGSGMSSLAVVMKKLGFDVQGSDYEKHFFTEDNLIKNNIKILPFNRDNIKDNMIIVRGNTFNDENVEVQEAIEKKLKIYTYQDMVDEITKKYDLFAVSGCHGKTTTSSMLAHVLKSNFLIGDGSGDISDSQYFVLEACEYKRHFLKYHPKIAIVTNIDLDHVDYFKNLDDVILAYQQFIDGSSIVIGCGDDENVRKLNGVNYFYGINPDNDFSARNIKYSNVCTSFDFYSQNIYIHHFDLSIFGSNMVLNTMAVISICFLEGLDLCKVEDSLKTFKCARRRFNEYIVLDNIVIDDYAHHPNEIKSVISSVKQKYPNKKIVSIFEPHTFSRTKEFCNDIANELNKCDYSYVMDIYPSREKQSDYPNITSDMILKNVNGEKISYNQIEKLLNYHDSVLLFMSPNDLSSFETEYIDKYSK